jgi:asparagine synthase (glutamine-hydrolysing)
MSGDGSAGPISGVWWLRENDRRSAESVERLMHFSSPHAAGREPRFEIGDWGRAASLGSARVVGDFRLDYPDDLIAALGDRRLVACRDPALLALHAWRRWELEAFDRLEGEFAVAIWDGERQRLVLARDAQGQRPLHFRSLPGGFAFASKAAMLACLGGRATPDFDEIAALLSLLPDAGEGTFFEGVKRVIPGHYVVIDRNGDAHQEAWWRPSLTPVPLGYGEAVEAMRAEVDRAVRAALVTDAAVVSAQLSGGHDSSMVVEAASRLIGPSKSLLAITARGASEQPDIPRGYFDEAAVAAATARMLPRVKHVEARVPPESPLAAVDRWQPADRPMLNPYNLAWLDASCAAARDGGADVMLTGDSGNATVSVWGADRLAILGETFGWRTLVREMVAYRRNHGATWPGLLAMTFGHRLPDAIWRGLARLRGRPAEDFVERAFLRPGGRRIATVRRRATQLGVRTLSAPQPLLGSRGRMQWHDPGSINHHVRAHHGIELRDPLGSRRVYELSLRLGPEHFYRDGKGRRLSRALLEGRVPEQVTAEERRGVQGSDWLDSANLARDEMARELDALARDPDLCDLFDVNGLRDKLANWPTRDSPESVMQALRGELMMGIAAARWVRGARERCSGGEP